MTPPGACPRAADPPAARGPIYGRLQAEYLKPLVDRCFGIAYRASVLGQAPENCKGKIFTVGTCRRSPCAAPGRCVRHGSILRPR